MVLKAMNRKKKLQIQAMRRCAVRWLLMANCTAEVEVGDGTTATNAVAVAAPHPKNNAVVEN